MAFNIPPELLQTIPLSDSFDESAFLLAQQQEPITSIRLNPKKYSPIFQQEENVPWSMYGKYLRERPVFTADPLLHAGCYYVQEASSMFLEYALKQCVDFSQTQIALDLCGAPGGKSTLLASLLSEESLLISNEVIQNRATILNENICKWGYQNTWVSNSDPKHFAALKNEFTILLMDAPCSGSGLFRKLPNYCHDWNMDNVNLCAQRQKRILHDSYDCLAQDGILVYMTCSFSQQENEDIVDYILDSMAVESIAFSLPENWGITETISEEKKGYGYRFYPHLLQGEGFFIACFKKLDGQKVEPKLPAKKFKLKHQSIAEFVDVDKGMVVEQQDNLLFIKEEHIAYMQAFSNHIKLIKKGIRLGKVIRNELLPDHELALFVGNNFQANIMQVNKEEAIAYLKKENIIFPEIPKGWALVQYEGIALGWIKNIGSRMNNYYPANYRILNQNILPS